MPQRRTATARRGAGRKFAAPRARRATAAAAPAPAPSRRGAVARDVGGSIGTMLGTKLGGPAGGAIGRALGRGAAGLFSRLIGKGAYTVKTNTITQPGSYVMNGIDQVPLMHNDMGTTRIRHREYVTDVFSTEDFTNITYRIQPTNSQLFPWLSAAAQNYEQHKWLGIVFEFKSLSANALTSANTGLGSVSLATQYNALNAPFSNKQELLNYQFASSCKPADSMLHPVECDPGQTPNQPLYIRIGSQEDGDARLYDIGVLNLVTQGMQSDGATIGELWISYDILLIKPRISSGLGLGLRTAFYTYSGGNTASLSPGDNAPLGSLMISTFDSIGLDFKFEEPAPDRTDCTITFPIGSEGLWLIQNTYFGDGVTGSAAQSPGLTTYTNCTHRTSLYNVRPGSTGSTNVGVNTGIPDCLTFSADNIISIPDPNLVATVKFTADTGWVLPAGNSDSVGNLVICQLNNLVQPATPAAFAKGHFGVQRLLSAPQHEEKEAPVPVALAPGRRSLPAMIRRDEPDECETFEDEGYALTGPPLVTPRAEPIDLGEKTVVRRTARPQTAPKS